MRTRMIALLIAFASGVFPVMITGQSVSVIIAEKTVNDLLAAVGPV